MAKKSLARQIEEAGDKIKSARIKAEMSIESVVSALEKETGLGVSEVAYRMGEGVVIIFANDNPDYDTPDEEEDEE